MKQSHSHPRGFTLVELIIYMSIVTVALIIFTNFFADVTHAAAKAKSKDEVRENGQLILTRIVQEVRSARCVDIAHSIPNDDHGTLRLNRDNCTTPTSTATFSWNSNAVQFTDGTTTAVNLSTSRVRVTKLRFEYNQASGSDVLIHLGLEPATTQPSTGHMELTTTVVPRSLLY